MNIGARIRQERQRRHLSQEALAEALGTTAKSISRWERGQAIPQAYYRLQFCRLFDLHPEELYEEPTSLEQEISLLPAFWNVPYLRNPSFTGREEILHFLYEEFHQKSLQTSTQLPSGQAIALSQSQALSGLGGIGKTQIAVEYAYRYSQKYQAILWVRAGSTEELNTSYSQIATKLNLPEKDEKKQEIIIEAVKTWLQHHNQWLLILDNADELTLITDFLPPVIGGHLLLTTRAGITGRLAKRLEVKTFTEEQGSLFLLRRSSLLPPDVPFSQATTHDQRMAQQIVHELGGLPLALDQAGAYINETECGLDDYFTLYHTHQDYLLKRRGTLSNDYPQSVATTWSLSFERVEQTNPAAVNLLRFCAFLAPDTISEEIITKGSTHLGSLLAPLREDPLMLNEIILTLRTYSLLNRNPQTHILSVHRLVQAVLRDSMPIETKKEWKQRTILSIHEARPNIHDIAQWDACERWLPHALVCVLWIEQEQIKTEEAASLLNDAGSYLHNRARYTEAEPLFLHALHIREHCLGPDHLLTAESLYNLALFYTEQGKYNEAESFFLSALRTRERNLRSDHPDIAKSLNKLAHLYFRQGKYSEAESLLLRALHIRESNLGSDHPDVASTLNILGILYMEQDRHSEAEPLLLRSLYIKEHSLEPNPSEIAKSLHNLATLYFEQGKYSEAEPLLLRALHIRESHLGPDHPEVASSLDGLAHLYRDQGKYSEAESLYLRTLHILEHSLGPNYPLMAFPLEGLAILYKDQGKYHEAEPLFLRALHIRKQCLGSHHRLTQQLRRNYALLLRAMKRDAQAKELEEET